MCCNPSKSGKDKVMKIFEDKDQAVFYKLVCLYRPIFPGREFRVEGLVTYREFKPGLNFASNANGLHSRDMISLPLDFEYDRDDPRGIHVYLPNPGVDERPLSKSEALVPVICRKGDFICADDGQAVFRKIEITQENWDTYIQPKIDILKKE